MPIIKLLRLGKRDDLLEIQEDQSLVPIRSRLETLQFTPCRNNQSTVDVTSFLN